MGKGRLEAFSDGVIAIIITIMVLELKVVLRQEAIHDACFPTVAMSESMSSRIHPRSRMRRRHVDGETNTFPIR